MLPININNVIREHFARDIDLVIMPIHEVESQQLYPEEKACISSAKIKRCREFAAGRMGARRLLRCYGINNHPLLQGQYGEPTWPEGIIGSISHCDDYCIVVTAKKKELTSLGVDVEPCDSLPQDVEDLVCTMGEKRWIQSINMENESIPWSKIIFSAKESAYKCMFSLVERFIDFREAEIKLNVNPNTFTVHGSEQSSSTELSSIFYKIKGCFIVINNRIFTVACIT